jgi:peptide subunit release factor RF-3
MNEDEIIITHMDILAFINGWDLVNKDSVVLLDELEEENEDECE